MCGMHGAHGVAHNESECEPERVAHAEPECEPERVADDDADAEPDDVFGEVPGGRV